jgi:hypothetical protein
MKQFNLLLSFLLLSFVSMAQFTGSLPVTLSGVPSGATGIQWYQDGASISGAQSATYIATTIGNYYATFTDASTTCTDDRTATFVMLNSGQSVTLSGPSGTGYQWFNGGISIPTATSANYSTATGGLYSLTYNNGTCVIEAKYYVFVLQPTGAGTIDCSKTQIFTAPIAGQAGQKTLVVTINVTAAGCFSPLSISGSGMTLANSVTQVCTNTTGVQSFSIPVNYDGTALGTTNFTIGSAGSCSANLTVPPKQSICDIYTLDCVPTTGPSLK